jgi:hypothetical protein
VSSSTVTSGKINSTYPALFVLAPFGPSRRAPELLSLVGARGLIKRKGAPAAIYTLVQPLRNYARSRRSEMRH